MKKLLIEEHISAVVMATMVLLAFVNIISRVISGFSFAFTEELIVYLFLVTTMFSTAAGVYRRVHMSLTLLSDKFTGKGQRFFILTSSGASILLFAILAWQSSEMMRKQILYEYVTPVMQIPNWIFTLSMVIGSALYIFRTVQITIVDWKATSGTQITANDSDNEQEEGK